MTRRMRIRIATLPPAMWRWRHDLPGYNRNQWSRQTSRIIIVTPDPKGHGAHVRWFESVARAEQYQGA